MNVSTFLRFLICVAGGIVLALLPYALTILLREGPSGLNLVGPELAGSAGFGGLLGAMGAGLFWLRQDPPKPKKLTKLASSTQLDTSYSQSAFFASLEQKPATSHASKRWWWKQVAFARLSLDFRWQLVSGAFQRRLRRNGKKLRNRPIFEFLDPEDVKPLEKALQTLLKDGKPFTQTLQFLPEENFLPSLSVALAPGSDTYVKDGRKTVVVRMAAELKRNDHGIPIAIRCRFEDLTKAVYYQKKVEVQMQELGRADKKARKAFRNLERLKESYRDLYHNAPVMYFSLDPEGCFVSFNDTLVRTLNYTREELLGTKYVQKLPFLGGRKTRIEPSHPFPQSEQEEISEARWQTKTGIPIDVWIHALAVYDINHNFVRWRCWALDLTERNRLANELRTRGDELERTNKRLKQINSELEAFTHIVSHDLKEPLRTLQAFSHILLEDYGEKLGEEGKEYISNLIRASRRMGNQIDDLLSLSQAGRTTRDSNVFHVSDVIDNVRADFADLVQRQKAAIIVEGALPRLVGDQYRITQLFANLIGNALKYNKSTEPRVVIGVSPMPALEPAQAVLFVRDNGIGIDPQYHQQIFAIFRRLHTQEEYEGTGVGLAICKKIVEAHGGRLWVESESGRGATFFFSLPLAPTTAADSPATSPIKSDPAITLELAAPKKATRVAKLLLVEDTIEIGAIIQKLGQRSGLAVTWFTSAEDGWEYLQQNLPDFLLLDIHLPGMNGLEFCRRIRQELKLSLPIALFSQEQRPEELRKLRELGANYFINKDLVGRPMVWQEKLQELLNRAMNQTESTSNG